MARQEMIRPVCPGCGSRMKPVPAEYRGKKGRCPKCKTIMVLEDEPDPVLPVPKTEPPVESGPSPKHGQAARHPVSTPDPIPDSNATRLTPGFGPAPDTDATPEPDPQATRLASSAPPQEDSEATRIADPPSGPEIEATRLTPGVDAPPSGPVTGADEAALAGESQTADSDATRLRPEDGQGPEPEPNPVSDPDATRLAEPGPAVRNKQDQPPLSWKPGDLILDTYRVEEILGQGAFGMVYRVRHLRWDMDLAVKTPIPEALAAHGAEIFVKEAQTWSELGLHPNIVSCYYVRDLDGAPRAFAEYVDGASLQQLIEQEALTDLETILDLAIQFAWGLAYAHGQDLVHQDVKPANVMVTTDKRAKVTDFGLARARGAMSRGVDRDAAPADGKTTLVESGGCTPPYASPEQLSGGKVSRATDAWSFAVSLLAVFTGGAHWRVGSAAPTILEDLLSHESPGAQGRNRPGMPESLAALLRDCFILEPENRLRDMREIAVRLMAIHKETTGKEYHRDQPGMERAQTADSLVNQALSLLDLGREALARKLLGQALELQPHHPEATYNLGLMRWRDAEINDLDLVQELEGVRATHTGSWVDELALGLVHMERGAFESAVEVLEEIDEEALQAEPQAARALAKSLELAAGLPRKSHTWSNWNKLYPQKSIFSQDRSRILFIFGKGESPRLHAVPGGELMLSMLTKRRGNPVTDADLNRDGTRAVLARDVYGLELWDLEQAMAADAQGLVGYKPQDLKRSAGAEQVLFLDATNRIVAGCGNGSVHEWDAATGEYLRTLRPEERMNSVRQLCATRDGQTLAVGMANRTVELWDLAKGEMIRVLRHFGGNLSGFDMSEDGRWIVATNLEKGMGIVNTQSESVRLAPKVYEQGGWVQAHGDLALGGALGGLGGVLKLWDMARGRCLRTFRRDVSPQAKRIALGGYVEDKGDGPARAVWELYRKGVDLCLTRRWYRPMTAPWLLCRVTESESVVQASDLFAREMAEAEAAWGEQDMRRALAHLTEARNQPGFSRDPGAVELTGKLSMNLPRRRLVGGWQSLGIEAHNGAIAALALTPDGERLVTAANAPSSMLSLRNTRTGTWIKNFIGARNSLSSLALSPDGKFMVTSHFDKISRVWELEKSSPILQLSDCPAPVAKLAVTRDGQRVFGLYKHNGTYLAYWQLDSGRRTMAYKMETEFKCMIPGPSGLKVALSDLQGKIQYLNRVAGNPTKTYDVGRPRPEHGVFGPGEKSLLYSGNFHLSLLDLETGEVLRKAQAGDHEGWCAVSTDFTHAFVVNRQAIEAWDIRDMHRAFVFEGHQAKVSQVAISRQGDFLVSGDESGNVRIWTLDWELEAREPGDWDPAIEPHARDFLDRTYMALFLVGKRPQEAPWWTEEQFRDFLLHLRCAGLGWVRAEGVRDGLISMAEAML